MIKLSIKGFSCIAEAEIELGALTILIGPQASGKSVISKLVNFCLRVLPKQFSSIESNRDLADFKKKLEMDFCSWFPQDAWGDKDFQINFVAGTFQVEFLRSVGTASRSKKLAVEFSKFFEVNYARQFDQWIELRGQLKSDGDGPEVERSLPRELEAFWRFQHLSERELLSVLGNDYIESQLFIPAGRALFTSAMKSQALFELGSASDPLTAQFGRLFSRIRDMRHPMKLDNSEQGTSAHSLMNEFFGGTIRISKNEAFVESEDGRKVPFSILSSGQQELMPLWLATRLLIADEATSELMYVEEPEAHLFPSAQASLTNYLVSFVASQKSKRRLFITTHSPYVLACINNLLKAGQLADKLGSDLLGSLSKIVPKEIWLSSQNVRAYAIKDKSTISIIDEDGLIDTGYLDDISNEVANTYSRLLELEYTN
jgi:energy-coupling factor transporter ATP-binding protein EcfA2